MDFLQLFLVFWLAIWAVSYIRCLVSGIWMIFIGIFVFILEGLLCTFLPLSIRRVVTTLGGFPIEIEKKISKLIAYSLAIFMI